MSREEKVEFFNKIMGQNISDDPENVPLELRQLGIKLIFEELHELAVASDVEGTFMDLCLEKLPEERDEYPTDGDNINVTYQADGLGDVNYTNLWCVNVFGHRKTHSKVFDRICESNNSKVCDSMEEAEATREYWIKESGLKCHIENIDGNLVVKDTNGKVRKSINYKPLLIGDLMLNYKK